MALVRLPGNRRSILVVRTEKPTHPGVAPATAGLPGSKEGVEGGWGTKEYNKVRMLTWDIGL